MELFRPENGPSPSPAELLARDEALLDYCDATPLPGFLTFWESATYFIVLGYGKTLESEVFQEQCSTIPILRRCTGGGTVLQGPGCLNYALILPFDYSSELESISSANCFIMERVRAAISSITMGAVHVQGHTDLTLNRLKFSGNAQRRKRRALLFHGSFLLHFDLGLISKTLKIPQQQPEYREQRPHETFLTNLNIHSEAVRDSLIKVWNVAAESTAATRHEIARVTDHLVKSKYSTDQWNRRA